jgi:glycosyltransferase involved in cell wall biosynthesis
VASEPHISVVLPVRNGGDTLDAQLQALSRQNFDRRWEILVVDNGSQDGSGERARRWGDRLPELRVIDGSTSHGAYGARNLGTLAARADRLAYCDADDVVGPDWLASLAAGLSLWPLVTGPIDLLGLNRREIVGWRREGNWDRLPSWHGFLPGAITANLGIVRSLFDALGGFEPLPSGSDLRFVWRAQLAGWELGFVRGAIVHRREPDHWWRYARRSFRYGSWEPFLYRDFRGDGMPRSSGRVAGSRWLAVTVGWPALASPSWRYAWLNTAAHRAGRVVGSVQARTLYP